MEILNTPEQAFQYVWDSRRSDQSVGIVPTMGALHAGHFSLVQQSAKTCDRTVASIFVNPTQFAEGEDLDRYPRTLQSDVAGLEDAGAAAVFIPEADAIYPAGYSTSVVPPDVAKPLEGRFRPKHFSGVATVVLKLFHLLPGTHAFFGQKDYQQLQVIRAMSRDLNVPIEIVSCPIVRESDGLAMSSRNRYLTGEDRVRATLLRQALLQAKRLYDSGERDRSVIESAMLEQLAGPSQAVDSVDYAVVVNGKTLMPSESIDDDSIALIAARVGETRLIDNLFLTESE